MAEYGGEAVLRPRAVHIKFYERFAECTNMNYGLYSSFSSSYFTCPGRKYIESPEKLTIKRNNPNEQLFTITPRRCALDSSFYTDTYVEHGSADR